jgi:hypothetical protein
MTSRGGGFMFISLTYRLSAEVSENNGIYTGVSRKSEVIQKRLGSEQSYLLVRDVFERV